MDERRRRRPEKRSRGWSSGAIGWVILGIVVVTASPASAFSPAPPEPEPFEFRSGIAFRAADGTTLEVDAYIPRGGGRHPAIVLVHGGSWTGGDKADFSAVGASLTELGWVALAVNYRLAVETIDLQASDVFATVRWTREHAAELHVDPRRIALLGASAGGQLAALAATRDGAPSLGIDAVVTWSGVFDFASLAPRDGEVPEDCNTLCQETIGAGVLTGVLGCTYDECPARYRDLSPVNHVTGMEPPMLLANSVDDAVPPAQAQAMARALRAAEVPAETVVVDGSSHGYELGPQVWAQTTGFLQQHLAPPDVDEDEGSSRSAIAIGASIAIVALLATGVWRRARRRRRARRFA